MTQITDAVLAIHGGTPAVTRPPMSWPIPDAQSAAAVAAVVESGHWFRVDGTAVSDFERRFAELQQAEFAGCVTSGTTALDTALRAVGVGPGDEVILPPYTFIASVMSVLYVGAVPVFVDVEPDTHVLDPELIEAAVTSRTKAIMPVHLAGRPCDMDRIGEVAGRHGLSVIEDAAQAIGAEWKGRRVGAIGDLGAFSFQSSKNITAGEGGAVTTNDPVLADRAYSLANVGRIRNGGWYQHHSLGYNLRLTEMQGALLGIQLDLHAERQRRREVNAALLTRLLADVDGVHTDSTDPRITAHGIHLVLLRVPGAVGRKDALVQALQAEGVPAGGGYPAGLHRNEAVRAATVTNGGSPTAESCPVTDAVTADTVVLPHFHLLGDEQSIQEIAQAFGKVIARLDRL